MRTQAKSKLALALDYIQDAQNLIDKDSAAYHPIISMLESANFAIKALENEAIQKQAALLINYRSKHA